MFVIRPLLTFHIFDFSVIAEWNSTKLDRKQDLIVLYQVCVFRADRKTEMVAWSLEPLNGIWWNLTENKNWMSPTKFQFLGWSKNKDNRPGRIVRFRSGVLDSAQVSTWKYWNIKDLAVSLGYYESLFDYNAMYEICML